MSLGDLFTDVRISKLERYVKDADKAMNEEAGFNFKLLREIRAIRQALVVIAVNSKMLRVKK